MQGVMIDEHQKWEHKAELLNEEEKKQNGYTGQIKVIDLGRLGETPQQRVVNLLEEESKSTPIDGEKMINTFT